MWGIQNIFWANSFFHWWKRLWDEKIAPYEETPCECTDGSKQVENGRPSIESLTGIYLLGKEIDALDKKINRSLRKYKMRRRVNPRHGWWLAMDRGRFHGVSYVG